MNCLSRNDSQFMCTLILQSDVSGTTLSASVSAGYTRAWKSSSHPEEAGGLLHDGRASGPHPAHRLFPWAFLDQPLMPVLPECPKVSSGGQECACVFIEVTA